MFKAEYIWIVMVTTHQLVNTTMHFQRIPQENQAKFLIVRKDTRLINVNHLMKYGLDEVKCFNQCFQFSKCHSVNINSEQNVCVINVDVDNGREIVFTSKRGWDYYEKEVGIYFKEEFALANNRLVYTIPYWSTTWTVYFEIKPKNVRTDSPASILHFIPTKCCLAGKFPKSSEPGVWFHPNSTTLHVHYTMDPQLMDVLRNLQNMKLSLGEYHKIKIVQLWRNGYFIVVEINGQLVHNENRRYPQPLTGVDVYAGDMFYDHAFADIRHLFFENN